MKLATSKRKWWTISQKKKRRLALVIFFFFSPVDKFKCIVHLDLNFIMCSPKSISYFPQVRFKHWKRSLLYSYLVSVYTADREYRGKHKLENEFIKMNAVSLSKMCRHGNLDSALRYTLDTQPSKRREGSVYARCAQTYTYMLRAVLTNAPSSLTQIPFSTEGGSVIERSCRQETK